MVRPSLRLRQMHCFYQGNLFLLRITFDIWGKTAFNKIKDFSFFHFSSAAATSAVVGAWLVESAPISSAGAEGRGEGDGRGLKNPNLIFKRASISHPASKEAPPPTIDFPPFPSFTSMFPFQEKRADCTKWK